MNVSTPSARPGTEAWGLLFILGLLWGGSFFFGRIAVAEIPPFTLVFFRLFLAALALHIYLHGRLDTYRLLARHWRSFAVMGLLNNALPHTMIVFGQTEIGAGLAAILNATTPIFTVLIANRFTQDEKLSLPKVVGCLLGFAGTAILIGPGVFSGTSVPLWALILPLCAALSYGFAGTYGKRFRSLPAPVTATGQLTASSVIMLPVMMILDRPWSLAMPSATVVAAVLGLALLSTALGYLLYFRIMALSGATYASLVTLLVPPSAVILGALFLGERLEAAELAGMVLIGIGLLVLNGMLRVRPLNQPG